MKKIVFLKLLSILSFILIIGTMVSCSDDDDVDSGEVKLLSFGPSGVKPGEQISIIGKNLNKVTSIELTGASVPGTAFTKQTPELIQLNVPVETDEGLVTLKTTDGDIVSKTRLSFEVVVKIESMTESARPGENVTINGDYLNWVKSVRFARDTTVIKFVSQTMKELVVTVPFGAETGPLVFSTGGTEPLSIETEKPLTILLPVITSISPNPVEREKNLTIKGTNLDLAEGVLFKGLTIPVTQFVSKSATQLVVTVPKAANKGAVTLLTYSKIPVESTEALKFVGDLPDLVALKYIIYDDALQNGWQNWGWGTTADLASTDNIRDGNAAGKFVFAGSWGAVKLANSSVETAKYSEITFSVFGTPGTKGFKLNVAANAEKPYVVTIEEGKWVEYKLKKSDLGNPVKISELMFQETGWKGTIYLDHIGLR